MADPATIESLARLLLGDDAYGRMALNAKMGAPPEPEINNPWRTPIVRGGIAARNMMGLDATPDQRVEDAFIQLYQDSKRYRNR